MITQDYLIANGFVKDEKCPVGVNRWEKTTYTDYGRDYFVSVTLSADGGTTEYGVVNFYSIGYGSRPYEYIALHRYFNDPINEDEFNAFLDRKSDWPKSVNP